MSAERGLRLTLARHGRAEDKAPGQTDFERSLDRRGVAEVAGMARRWLETGVRPDILVASAARRTTQTAAAFARVLGVPAHQVREARELYLASAETLLETVRATEASVHHLMVVGHNPGLVELAQLLAPRARLEGFETAATCTMRLDARDWSAARAGAARDLQYDSPARYYDLWS